MNKSLVFHYLSKAMLLGSALFFIPAIFAIGYGEYDCMKIFIAVGVGVALLFLPISLIKPKNKKMYAREGLAITAMIWILFSLAGALPFFFSGCIKNFADAFFEASSGFTTTGCTILSDVEALPKSMLLWRSLTNWIGGMGVLVFAIAILPSSADSLYLMQAECPGPDVNKLVPKGKKTAVYLYIMYTVITVLVFVFLLFGKMPVFDSVCCAMSTAATGGFSIKNAGVGFYNSPYIEGVVTVGMFLFGINFSLYYLMIIRRFKEIKRNSELKAYIGIIIFAVILITINILPQYGSVKSAFRYSSFQVVSIMTSTGFGTADFCKWPAFSQTLLLLLMFIGASSGSTGGGFKVSRFLILLKSASLSIRRLIHPNSVNVVKIDGKVIDSDSVHSVMRYLIIYLALAAASVLLISIDNVDFGTAFSSVLTCFNNIGPGINKVGPTENFGFYSDFAKVVLSLDMLLGRLECLPFLVMLSPSVWRNKF